jgi:uncharacterized membrane protein YdfJ with MMPL/SSD domain
MMVCFCGGRNNKDWIVVLVWLLVVLFALVFFVSVGYPAEVCFSEGDAKRLVVELEQKRVLEQEVKEQEGLIENLKKQNELLRQENQLLKEQVQLLKEQRETYKVLVDEKDKEIRRQRVVGFFEKAKSFLMGAGMGVFVTILVLH